MFSQCFLLEGWSNLQASDEKTSCGMGFPDLVHYVQIMSHESCLFAAFWFLCVYTVCTHSAIPPWELMKPKFL